MSIHYTLSVLLLVHCLYYCLYTVCTLPFCTPSVCTPSFCTPSVCTPFVRCLYTLSVHHLSVHRLLYLCLYTLYVHSVCILYLSTPSVHHLSNVCTLSVRTLSVHSVCTPSVYLLYCTGDFCTVVMSVYCPSSSYTTLCVAERLPHIRVNFPATSTDF